MNYPLRYPLANVLAMLGATITVNINFIYDDEEKVFIATSDDIKGLVIETASFEQLRQEVVEAIPHLLNDNHAKPMPSKHSDVIFKSHMHAA